jgi:hypothetical protein
MQTVESCLVTLPKTQTLSHTEVDRVCSIISEREGVRYKFFRFLNLHKLSLVLTTDTNEQKVLTAEHCVHILNGQE